jgi:magnesium transporter
MELAVYFGDIVDHVDKIWDGLDEYKEIIEGLNDTHDSLATNRMNDILRVLTILATIGTTLTVVASFYGMNVPLPGGSNPGGSLYTWIILLVIMLAIMGGMLYFFRRHHWL